MEKYVYQYKDKTIQYNADESDKDKYIVFTCAKNEDDYIVEWVDYHLNIGFDKIIICDNNDGDSLNGILNEYISNGTVELFSCHGLKSFQVGICDMFLRASNFKWCAFFDCDEFFELNDGSSDVKDFLSTVGCDCVFVNWLMMSNCGKLEREEGTVQERFTYPYQPVSMCKENIFGKSILRGGIPNTFTFKTNIHKPITVDGSEYEVSYGGYYVDHSDNNVYCSPLRYKRCYLKHYYTKSLEEFKGKKERGYPDGTSLKINLDTFKYYATEKYDMEKLLPSSVLNVENFSDLSDKVGDYKFVQIKTTERGLFALHYYCLWLLFHKRNTTFFIDQDISEEMFNNLFGLAFNNGNRVIVNIGHDALTKSLMKYAKDDNYYFYILHAK